MLFNQTMKKEVISILALATFGISLQAATDVTFNLHVDSRDLGTFNTGYNINNFTVGENPGTTHFAIGFDLEVTSFGGVNPNYGHNMAAFCIELEQPIGLGAATHQSINLNQISSGVAGVSGTASTGIAVGGIGLLKAAQVRYAFDNYYTSSLLSDWSVGNSLNPDYIAFQLAIWEISHDNDLSLSSTSGHVYINGAQTSDNISSANKLAAINQAQAILNGVAAAGVTESYTSVNFLVVALENVDVAGAQQDLVYGIEIAPIPEPSEYAFIFGLLGIGFVATRRKFFAAV